MRVLGGGMWNRPSRVREGPGDHQLVAAVRGGDHGAFEALYARYHREITAYVGRMLKDRDRAEDVTQEVFVSGFLHMRKTQRPIAFKPWIYEIARNACIDAHRRARWPEEISFDGRDTGTGADCAGLVTSEPDPYAAVHTKQAIDHLWSAFGALSETHHRILVLRELEGRSYDDIAERLGLSRPAVASTLFRARKRLAEAYGELASERRAPARTADVRHARRPPRPRPV